ncbi:hypothetical protein N792_04070 [Lysobacter concretionis Ko07 = DSM 16239]|uniref:MobA-like NTP transferase domain-containing protein n=1 Tax=Lysobacter concretionis Ko07 = DSM 16239 TaxID=1122185 RepID=A0A0A0EMV1_9GAMM|nr:MULTISPECIES: molybdenum cofactor guanylyltransferase [Lysobacter]KGM52296.1 hypothetical protein N792_04070 [Lysobacter concretionis Ko07 = DSM 16239]
MPVDRAGWTGVVLAGGRSSRMGRDKALLDWHGRPLLEHMQALLREAGAARVIVSGPYGGLAVPDRAPGKGPMGGIASIAATLPDGVLVLVPVDMPRLTPTMLSTLAGTEESRCTHYAGYVLPMRLLLDRRTRAVLAELDVAADDQKPGRGGSLHALHERLHGVQLVPAPGSDEAFANCNTPDQWQEMHQ